MPTARHLLVASLSLLAASAAAQTQYAWVGTYNPNGEGLYRFTVDGKTGELRDKALVSSLPNVAQLTVSQDGKTLYAASEVEKGVVQAWRIAANGELSSLNQVASGGAGPVYLSLTPNGRHLYACDRTSSLITVFSVSEDGSVLAIEGFQPTETQPRGFNIDHSGKYLIAAGQKSHHIALYEIKGEQGLLEEKGRYAVGQGPMWVVVNAH